MRMKLTQKKLLPLLLSTILIICTAVSPFGVMTAKAAKANFAWSGSVPNVVSPITGMEDVTVTFNFHAESYDNGKNVWFTEDSTWSVSAKDFDNQYCAVSFIPNNTDDFGIYGMENTDGSVDSSCTKLNTVYTDNNNYYYIMRYVKGQPLPVITPGLVDFIKKNGPGELRFWLSDAWFGVTPCCAFWHWKNVTFDKFHIGDTPVATATEAVAETSATPATAKNATAAPTAEEIVAQFDITKTYTAKEAATVVKDFVDGLKALGVSIAPEFTEQVTAVNPVLGQALKSALGKTTTVEPAAASTSEKDTTAPASEATAENPPAEAPATAGGSYTVEQGDSLFKIAKKAYGDGKLWKKIYEANKDQIRNTKEYIIYAGQNFVIPTIQ